MSFPATTFKRCGLSFLLAGLGTLSVFSQAANSPVAFSSPGGITTTMVPAPTLASTGGGGNGQWMKVEFKYTIALPAGSTATYLDELQFKIWIEGIDLFAENTSAPGQGVAVGLTGSVTYVCLPVGKDVFGSFYISPAVLARYSKTPSDFDRKFDIHIEAYQGGALMDRIDKNKETDPDWFKKLSAVDGCVFRQNQCPFIVSDPDRYPPIKVEDK